MFHGDFWLWKSFVVFVYAFVYKLVFEASKSGLSRCVKWAKFCFQKRLFLVYFQWMLKVVLFGVGYMVNIFVFFRLACYLLVILVIKVLLEKLYFTSIT
jgi:hypothetical protein